MEYKTPITISELLENKEKFLGKFITVEGNYIHPSYIYIPEGLCLLNGDDKDFARQEEINIYCWRDDELQLVEKVPRDKFLNMKTKTFLYPVYILEDTYEKKKMVVSSKIPCKYNLGKGKIYYRGFLHDYPNLPLSE
ncbi:MAG: hypothetical protein ACOX6Q_03915 [Candidatus Dojkabacteria bacterium]